MKTALPRRLILKKDSAITIAEANTKLCSLMLDNPAHQEAILLLVLVLKLLKIYDIRYNVQARSITRCIKKHDQCVAKQIVAEQAELRGKGRFATEICIFYISLFGIKGK